jgi:hypothetical protein
MPDEKKDVVKEGADTAKGVVIRLGLWIAGLAVILAISAFTYEAAIVPMQTDLAVAQLESSDAAFQNLQAFEQAKNRSTIWVPFAIVAWSLVLWFGPGVRLAREIYERANLGS